MPKRALAVVLAVGQTLILPANLRVRPIQTETLFRPLVSNFIRQDDRTTYVQTGDIPAMWLRDSAAQALPYVRFAPGFPALKTLIAGVIERDAKNILINSYADAFDSDYRVWENKWEIDSLAWPVMLVSAYYAGTHDRKVFTPTLHAALRRIVATYSCQQHHDACRRYAWPHPVPTQPTYNAYTGMIWSAFRPSDEPVEYHYNIPQNAMAAVALQMLSAFARDAYKDDRLARDAAALSAQVRAGVQRYGRIYNSGYGGMMYVYETDGLGRDNSMDDANIPNLTTLPYIGWCRSDDPVYLNTRSFTLDSDDPYYYSGRYATGLGSSHTPRGWVWPLGIIGAALTASRRDDVVNAIEMLDQSDTLDGLVHESFNPDNPAQFTRPQFGWANAFWADLLFHAVAGYAMVERDVRTPAIVTPAVQAKNRAALTKALRGLFPRR